MTTSPELPDPSSAPDLSGGPVVETSLGPLRGVREDGLAVFRGVPYAAPPTGALRWRPAAPHPGWTEVRDASAYGPSAPTLYFEDPILGGHSLPPFDEDCLTLNVWTPAADGRKRPVLVWLHGGGFVSGSGNLPIYAGDTFARDGDLVVVSVSYRIGALGYLYLGAEDGTDAGNFWITDQIAALRWVQANIEAFGGDPDNVTVAGQSGGAFSTAAIAARPEGAGLFHRMILQSPPLGLTLPTPDESLATTKLFMDVAGVDSVAALRELPWERLVEATMGMFMATGRLGHWRVPFLPVLDGVTLTEHPLAALSAPTDATASVDILLGWTRDEATFAFALDPGTAAADAAQADARFAESFGSRGAELRARYARERPGATPGQTVADLTTDEFFRAPGVELAEARGVSPHPAWIYQFDYGTPAYDGILGAAHCLELPFTFRNPDRWTHAPFVAGIDADTYDTLGTAMHDAWIAFVRSGDPNHAGIPTWQRYTTEIRTAMHFGEITEPSDAPIGPLPGELDS
ncbi:carboxylesterase/lipase family protein [Yinghuangia soli]|uniref:Carboxylic ester hydrolase n=1 Tax=Yinghuangia soli TaxID=2908204 RepID=A0AA41PWT8_9ACTN|nr:carboxylesterase family protein [Yinghuangia soli]MCF2527320.1 carboxylesterase family protein [Yinghuangia soli]